MSLFKKASERFKEEAKKAKKKTFGIEVAKWSMISDALGIIGDIMLEIHNENEEENCFEVNISTDGFIDKIEVDSDELPDIKNQEDVKKENRKDYKQLKKEETKSKLKN